MLLRTLNHAAIPTEKGTYSTVRGRITSVKEKTRKLMKRWRGFIKNPREKGWKLRGFSRDDLLLRQRRLGFGRQERTQQLRVGRVVDADRPFLTAGSDHRPVRTDAYGVDEIII